jgi:hypothetical protein
MKVQKHAVVLLHLIWLSDNVLQICLSIYFGDISQALLRGAGLLLH